MSAPDLQASADRPVPLNSLSTPAPSDSVAMPAAENDRVAPKGAAVSEADRKSLEGPAPATAPIDDSLERYFVSRYAELRRMARKRVGRIGELTLLNPTSLLHECFLKLHRSGCPVDAARCTLPYLASVMRSIVVDHLRQRLNKHSNVVTVDLEDDTMQRFAALPDTAREALMVDEALVTLQVSNKRLASVVEMKFYGGFSESEIAEALQLDQRTVRRDWSKARALLRAMIRS